MAKDGSKAFLRLYLSNLGTHYFQELIEVDWLVFAFEALYESVGKRSLPGLSQFVHDLIDFQWIDGPRVVLVKQLKHISQLFVLFGEQPFLPTDWLLCWHRGHHLGSICLYCPTHI